MHLCLAGGFLFPRPDLSLNILWRTMCFDAARGGNGTTFWSVEAGKVGKADAAGGSTAVVMASILRCDITISRGQSMRVAQSRDPHTDCVWLC